MQWHHSGACHCLQAAKAVLLDDKVRHLAVEIEIIDFEPGTFFATDARISRDEREPVSRVHVNHRPVAGLETFDASTTTLPKGQGIESFQVIGGPWHAVGILGVVLDSDGIFEKIDFEPITVFQAPVRFGQPSRYVLENAQVAVDCPRAALHSLV